MVFAFQDYVENYTEAARCYREAIISFKVVAQDKHTSPKVQSAIMARCSLYEERLGKLNRYLSSEAYRDSAVSNLLLGDIFNLWGSITFLP